MAIADMRVLVTSTLINDSDVFNLVEGRIFPNSLAEFDAGILEFPRIHVRMIGGSSPTWSGGVVAMTVQVQSWSKDDYDEAWAIDHEVMKALNLVRLSLDGTSVVLKRNQVGQENFDPDQKLYYVTTTYKAFIAEQAYE